MSQIDLSNDILHRWNFSRTFECLFINLYRFEFEIRNPNRMEQFESTTVSMCALVIYWMRPCHQSCSGKVYYGNCKRYCKWLLLREFSSFSSPISWIMWICLYRFHLHFSLSIVLIDSISKVCAYSVDASTQKSLWYTLITHLNLSFNTNSFSSSAFQWYWKAVSGVLCRSAWPMPQT